MEYTPSRDRNLILAAQNLPVAQILPTTRDYSPITRRTDFTDSTTVLSIYLAYRLIVSISVTLAFYSASALLAMQSAIHTS